MSEVKAKKGSMLTIEKELLSSYMEAVSDLKRLGEKVAGVIEINDFTTLLLNDFKSTIDKHVNKLRSSGIWE